MFFTLCCSSCSVCLVTTILPSATDDGQSILLRPSTPTLSSSSTAASGRVQMEPPSYSQGLNGNPNDPSHQRAFSPASSPNPNTGTMPPSSPPQSGAAAAAAHKRRQYAKDQTAAYDYSAAGAGGALPPAGGAYGAPAGQHQDPAAAAAQPYPGQQQQFFSPAFGDPAMHQQQPQQNNFYGNSGPNYQGPIGPGAPVHGRSFSQQYPGQQGAYQQPGVAGLSNQFGQMGIGGQRPVSLASFVALARINTVVMCNEQLLTLLFVSPTGSSTDNQSHRSSTRPSWS